MKPEIMRPINIIFKFLIVLSLFGLMSCEDDDDESLPDPTYDAPIITLGDNSILDGSSLELFVGQSIIYSEINITGSVGLTSFKVLIDGEEEQSQEFIGNTGQIETSFEFEVPGDWIDTTRQLTFVAEDVLGQVTEANVDVSVGTVTPQYDIENVELNGQEFKRITGTININETLDNNSLWIIKDSVQVAQQIKLTITEGTQIFAETDLTILYVNQLAEVDWQGTATNPIVFNSLANAPGQGPGDDSPGQWRGIRIDGDGPGSNSGIIRYLRQMYAGFGSDGENAFRLDNVGSGTTIEYVQVYKNDQRAFRLNDGDVGLKYAISTNGAGTGFRMDDDWNGTGQFWVVNHDINAGNAIEGREGNPVLSNITISGVGFNSPGDTPDDGFRIRNGGNARIYNAVCVGVDQSLRYSGGSEQGVANGVSFFRDSASFNNIEDDGTGFHPSAAFFNPTSPDYEPVFNNSIELFEITDSYVGISTLNSSSAGTLGSFFTDVNYIGAVEPGNDWTVGWCLNLDGTIRQ